MSEKKSIDIEKYLANSLIYSAKTCPYNYPPGRAEDIINVGEFLINALEREKKLLEILKKQKSYLKKRRSYRNNE